MIAELLFLLLVFCLLLLSAYFASCETALTAYSKPKMFSIAQDGNKRAKVIVSLQPDITLVLSAILTCCTIINALVVSLSNSLFVEVFGESAIFYGPIVVSIFIVLLEIFLFFTILYLLQIQNKFYCRLPILLSIYIYY